MGVPSMGLGSESLLEMPTELVRQELGDLWVMPRELGWLVDPKTSAPPDIAACFKDPMFRTQADVGASKRIRFGCRSGADFLIAGLLAPPLPLTESVLFLTIDREVLIAVRTYFALGTDGVLESPGHEVGVTLLTPAALAAQRDEPFVYGETLDALALEVRDEAGRWQRSMFSLSLPSDASVTVRA